METSVEAAEVLVTPQPNNTSSLDPESSESEAAAAACATASSPSSPPSSPSSSSSSPDPMEEFSRQLKSIIHIYGSAASLLDKQCPAEVEKVKEEAKDDITGATETEVSLIMQSLNELASPEEKLDDLVRKYAELAALRRCDAQKLVALQQKLSVLLEERQELQAERRSSVAARSKLEALCREQQSYYNVLREEMLQRCREDESKRTEITTHFQSTLAEIQSQIELHSARNDKLCRENISLTDKLENLMTQCERREESLEKINKHRDLQHKLTEAKLHQANALLAEAEEKHKREKEYLLREAIDKTKKCFAMKEQELAMKKKLTLYGQKFDEFQATLAKSNEIYARFKQEMENMSAKMKKMEKESTLWKTRFENCNKALTDMIEERTEKGKEYDLFVLRIQKLEKLCRALQDERKVLYDKIKDVRNSSANLPSKLPDGTDADDEPEGAKKAALLTPDELQEIQEEDPVLTEDMSRLKEEQAKLQEFAATLLAEPVDYDEEENEVDLEEDLVTSVFVSFKTKPQMKKDLDLVPEQVEDVKSKKAESKLPQPVNVEKVAPTMEAPTPQEKTLETTPADPNTEVQQPIAPEPKPEPEQAKVEPPTDAMKAELLEEPGEEKPVVLVHSEKDQQQESTEPATASDPGKSKADLPADTVEAEILEEPGEEKPVVPVHDEKDQQQESTEPTTASDPGKSKADLPADTVEAEILEEPGEEKPVVPVHDEKDQQPPVEPVPMPETEKAKADPLKCPEVMKAEILEDTTEVKPVEDKKVESQTSEPVQAPENASPPSESASENTWKAAGSSDADSSKKQVPKKKKKRSNKNAS